MQGGVEGKMLKMGHAGCSTQNIHNLVMHGHLYTM